MELAAHFFEFAAFLPHVGAHEEREFGQGEELTLEKFPIALVLTGSVGKRVRKFDVIGNYARATKQKATEEKPIEEKIVDEVCPGSVIESTSFFVGSTAGLRVAAVARAAGTRVLFCESTEGIRAAIKTRREKIGNFLNEISDFDDPLFPLRFRLEYVPKNKHILLRAGATPRRLYFLLAGNFMEQTEVAKDERNAAFDFVSSRMRFRSDRKIPISLRVGSVLGADYFFPTRRPTFATQDLVASEESWVLVADETLTESLDKFLAKTKSITRNFRASGDADVSAYHHQAKTYRFYEDSKRDAEPATSSTHKSEISSPQIPDNHLVPPVQFSDEKGEERPVQRALVQRSPTLERKLRDFTYLVVSKSGTFHATIRSVFLGTRCGIFYAPTAMEAIKYLMELKQYGNFEETRILVDRKFPDYLAVCGTLSEVCDEAKIIFVLNPRQEVGWSPFPVISGFRNAGDLRELMNNTLA